MIYIAPSAVLVGDVTVEDHASVWHGAVLRGDFDSIVVGPDSNVQDNAVVHVDRGMPAIIGARVTVGHAAVVHGCRIGDDCLIGMNGTINSGAVIGPGSIVASGAVVRETAEIPAGSVVAGVPAKVIRPVDETLRRRIDLSWTIYRGLAERSLPGKPPIRGAPSKQAVFELSEEFTRLIRDK
jgi:carbonic anhydrase/acetyltransferase-like protein (isoleucine patch superfamily)